MTTRTPRFLLTLPFVLLAVAACGDDDPLTPREQVAGTYEATTFVSEEEAGEIDWLDAGGAVTLILRSDGTTGGSMFIPGGGEEGEDLDADLAGTFTIAGDQVVFEQEADTFIRDADWTWDDAAETLSTEEFGLRVVLTRQ